MKAVFDVKNMDIRKPISDNSVMLFDAASKQWYITSKESLLKEFYARNAEAVNIYNKKFEELENKFNEFQNTFSQQYKQIVELVKLLTEQERK